MKKTRIFSWLLVLVMALGTVISPAATTTASAAGKLTKLSLAKAASEVEVGKKVKLKVKKKPVKAKAKLKWSSSNKAIAKVNKKGVVTGVSAGVAKITVKAKVGKKTIKASKKITVKAASAAATTETPKTTEASNTTPAAPETPKVQVTGLTVSEDSLSIELGSNDKIETTVAPANATNQELAYTSSDEDVAVVNEKGVVTAKSQGKCTITATTTDGSDISTKVTVQVKNKERPRVIITQDAEVDDQNSLTHLLLYANEIEIQGIVQTASKFHWEGVADADDSFLDDFDNQTLYQQEQSHKTSYRWPGTDWMYELIDDYAEVYPNLVKNDPRYPSPASLKKITKIGNIGYEGQTDVTSEGVQLIKEAILDDDERTLYITAWGGTNSIARALMEIEDEYRSQDGWDELHKKISAKISIGAYGEQDNTYDNYIAEEWPDIQFYQISATAYGYMWRSQLADDPDVYECYASAYMKKYIEFGHGALLDNYVTWGDGTYLEGEDGGSQFGSNEGLMVGGSYSTWLDWINGRGQRYEFISEGDTPTFFVLLDNGLRNTDDGTTGITYGGYAGRYVEKTDEVNSKGEKLNYWEMGQDYSETKQAMEDSDIKYLIDIQHEFAVRADYCIAGYDETNHEPAVSVEEGIDLTASAGEKMTLHALASDPDGDDVTIEWSHYGDADTYAETDNARIALTGKNTDTVSFTIPEDAKSGDTIFIVVKVTDDDELSLSHYQKVFITVK